MLYCFNCRKVCYKPHFHITRNAVGTRGYWTCKKPEDEE